jgi:hypothetical protein
VTILLNCRPGGVPVFVVRQAHLDAIRRAAFADLEVRILAYLLAHYPGGCAAIGDKAAVRAFVRRGMDRAIACNLDTAGAITVFFELLVQFGEQFERSPDRVWAMNILSHPTLPGYVKVGAIRDRFDETTGGRILLPAAGMS